MKYLYLVLLLIKFNPLYSDEHNSKLINDVERLGNDLQDLQIYVYNNLNPENQNNKLDEIIPSSDQVSDLEEALKSINFRLEELEIKISDLFSLYINKNELTLSTIKNSDEIVLEKEESQLVSGNSKTLGQLNLAEIDSKEEIQFEDEVIITNQEVELIQKKTKEQIDIKSELVLAKNFIASLDNSSAIVSLLKIINSNDDDKLIISEAYYWLGRTYFIKQNYIESVKYFGIRHRDYSSINNFKADNYFWLAKSLIKIGDIENACLVMEDIIFSNDYQNHTGIIEDSKSLQKEQGCGLIID